jgi:hypothetical protein
MATTIRADIYARGEVSFTKFLFLSSWFAKLLKANFFVLPKYYIDTKLTCLEFYSRTRPLRTHGCGPLLFSLFSFVRSHISPRSSFVF